VIEGLATPHPAPALGLFAMVAVPAGILIAVVSRALLAAWQPGALRARLTEDGGSMPRLAGWIVTIWLGAFALAWTTFQGTWQLAAWTAFKPLAVGFIQPLIAVATVMIVVAVSRPLVSAVAAITRWFDTRWRRRGRRTLLSIRILVAATLVGTGAAIYLVWRFIVRGRFAAFDTSLLLAPLVALAVAWIVHLAWPRLERVRSLVTVGLTGLAVIAIGIAIAIVTLRPAEALAVWGARPVAGVAVAWFDLERLRDAIPHVQFAPVPLAGAKHPDIILVTVSGLRADRTPSYAGAVEMPALRDLGTRGAVYAYTFAPSNDTERSLPSMLTGTAPNRIKPDPRHVTLAERLRAGGYDTAGFVCRGLDRAWLRGFDHLTIEPEDPRLAEAARTWLGERRARGERRPLFLWLHLDAPTAWAPRLGEVIDPAKRSLLYDQTLVATDHAITRVVTGFTERVPIVIITADHGEALGDHDQIHHGTDLYNSQIRVPFVIAGPGVRTVMVQEVVSGTDLTPTVLELAGFVVPGGSSMDGKSVAQLALGTRQSQYASGSAFAIAEHATFIQGRWKLIEVGPMYELYDILQDMDEDANLVTVRPDLVIELRKMLDAKQASSRRSPFR